VTPEQEDIGGGRLLRCHNPVKPPMVEEVSV
jgi:peptide/nickel transport system ATP-binding protein